MSLGLKPPNEVSAERCPVISRVGAMLQNWKPEVTKPDCFPKNVKCCTFIYSQLLYCQHSVFEVWIKVYLIRKKILKIKGILK